MKIPSEKNSMFQSLISVRKLQNDCCRKVVATFLTQVFRIISNHFHSVQINNFIETLQCETAFIAFGNRFGNQAINGSHQLRYIVT